MSKPSILIVEDSKTDLLALEKIVGGIVESEITTCRDGKKAMNLVKKSNFDVIITDIYMPGYSGLNLIKEIKRKEKFSTSKTHLIVSTSSTEKIIRKKLDAFNIDALVEKPFSVDRFKEALSGVL